MPKISLGQITPVFMEKMIGDLVGPNLEEVHGGPDPDTNLQAYVKKVGTRLTPFATRKDLPFSFTVLATKEIPNAYALGNGNTYITRALLKILDNEAQLAAVMGHELGHVNRRHIAKQLDVTLGGLAVISAAERLMKKYVSLKGLGAESPAPAPDPSPAPPPAPAPPPSDEDVLSARDVMLGLLVNGYSRQHELEADKSGLIYSARAGYNPYAIVDVMKKFQTLEGEPETGVALFMRSHPLASQRISELESRIKADFPMAEGDLGYDEYQEAVNPEKVSDRHITTGAIIAGGAGILAAGTGLYLLIRKQF